MHERQASNICNGRSCRPHCCSAHHALFHFGCPSEKVQTWYSGSLIFKGLFRAPKRTLFYSHRSDAIFVYLSGCSKARPLTAESRENQPCPPLNHFRSFHVQCNTGDPVCVRRLYPVKKTMCVRRRRERRHRRLSFGSKNTRIFLPFSFSWRQHIV